MDKGNVRHSNAVRESRGQERPGQQVEDRKGGKSRDKRWSPEVRGDVQVEGLSAPSIVEG